MLLHVVAHRLAVEVSRHPQGSGERSAAQRQLQARGRGVQVCAPARHPASGIGHGHEAGTLTTDDDAQQILLGGPLPTAHTGADDVTRLRQPERGAVFADHC